MRHSNGLEVVLCGRSTGCAPLRRSAHKEPAGSDFRTGHQNSPRASCGGRGHSANQSGELILWEVASGQLLDELIGHDGPVFSVAFSPDGRILASGGADKAVRLWSLATQEEITQLRRHKRPIHSVAFHPGTSHVVAVGMRGVIKGWDTPNGRLVSEVPMTLTGPVIRLTFSRDGHYLATAGPGLAVNLWSTSQDKIH